MPKAGKDLKKYWAVLVLLVIAPIAFYHWQLNTGSQIRPGSICETIPAPVEVFHGNYSAYALIFNEEPLPAKYTIKRTVDGFSYIGDQRDHLLGEGWAPVMKVQVLELVDESYARIRIISWKDHPPLYPKNSTHLFMDIRGLRLADTGCDDAGVLVTKPVKSQPCSK